MTTTEQRLTPEQIERIRYNLARLDRLTPEAARVWLEENAKSLVAELDAVRRELVGARKDSTRLDWWEKHEDVYKTRDDETSDAILSEVTGSWNDPQWRCLARARSLRAAIDAAMAQDGDQ